MNEDTQIFDSAEMVSDEWKILKALQQLAKESAGSSPEAKSADKIPSLEELVGYIVDSDLNLPICSEQLSIIYQDYGQAKPHYVAINGQVVNNDIPDNYPSKPCPADHKLITDIIDNTALAEARKEEITLLDRDKLAEYNGLFTGYQNVLLVPMRLTINKRIGVFVVCDSNGDPRFTNQNRLIELLDVFSDLSAYFMRHNVRKRRNAALQRIQTEIMSLGETPNQLRGHEVIDVFMDGVKGEDGKLIVGTGLKDWFVGAEAYLLLRHPLDVDSLAMAYDNNSASVNYRIDPAVQLDKECERDLLGSLRERLTKGPVALNSVVDIEEAGITAKGCKSWVAVPLRLGKKTVIGFLVLQNKNAEYAFEDGEDEMLDAVSDFLALLLARLYRERISESWRAIRNYYLEHPKEHDKRLESLYTMVAKDLETIHGVKELVIMRYDHSDLGLNSVYSSSTRLNILLADKKKGHVEQRARFIRTVFDGDNSTCIKEKAFDSFHEAVMDILISSRKVRDDDVCVQQLAKSLTICDIESGDKYLVSPMRTETHSRGCFIFPAQNVSKFTAEKLDDLSDALAKKVENYGRWKRYSLLIEFGKKIAELEGELSESKIAEEAKRFIGQAMYTENLYIAMYEPESNTIRFLLALRKGVPWRKDNGFEEDIEGTERTLNRGLRGKTEEIIVSGEPLLHLTRAIAEKWYKEDGHKEHAGNPLASWVGVPIFSEKGVIGVIAAFHDELDYIYSDRDVFFLQQISFSVSGMLRALELESVNMKLEGANNTILEYEENHYSALIAQDVTHRLNNSLGSIEAESREALDDINKVRSTGDTKILEYTEESLKSILHTTNKLLIETNNILDFSETEIDFPMLIKDVIDQVSVAKIKKSGLSILIDEIYQANTPTLIFGVHRLVFNSIHAIVENAAEAILLENERNKKYYIKIEVFEENNVLKILVTDNGVPIAKERELEIFKVNKDKGYYGLWRAKKIINNKGGDIVLINNPGDKGKIFEISMALPEEEKPKVKKLAYVLDDESSWRRLFKKWLEEYCGFEVILADTAKNLEKILSLDDKKPDLVTLDISLNEKWGANNEGLPFISKVKNIYPCCKVVVISGYIDDRAGNYLKDADQKLKKVDGNDRALTRENFTNTIKQLFEE